MVNKSYRKTLAVLIYFNALPYTVNCGEPIFGVESADDHFAARPQINKEEAQKIGDEYRAKMKLNEELKSNPQAAKSQEKAEVLTNEKIEKEMKDLQNKAQTPIAQIEELPHQLEKQDTPVVIIDTTQKIEQVQIDTTQNKIEQGYQIYLNIGVVTLRLDLIQKYTKIQLRQLIQYMKNNCIGKNFDSHCGHGINSAIDLKNIIETNSKSDNWISTNYYLSCQAQNDCIQDMKFEDLNISESMDSQFKLTLPLTILKHKKLSSLKFEEKYYKIINAYLLEPMINHSVRAN